MKRSIKMFSLCALMLATIYSCKKNMDNKAKETDGIVMNLSGRLDGCGFVIKLDDGNSLEVREVPAGVTLKDNKRVHIKYEEVNSVSICMIGPVANILELKYI